VLKKKNYDEYWTDAPIGVIQSGSIRTTLNETDHDGNIISNNKR
jgi:5'-nucleotidase